MNKTSAAKSPAPVEAQAAPKLDKKVTVTLSADLLNQLDDLRWRERLSLSELVRQILTDGIARRG